MATYGIRHPWFNMPTAKRKRPHSSSSSDNDEPALNERPTAFRAYVGGGSPKRRRCSTLERGFAHMNLSYHIPQTSDAQASTTSYPSPPNSSTSPDPSILELDARSPSPAAMDSDYMYPVVQPGSIEEPPSPGQLWAPPLDDVPEIQMKSQSWYEPEKDRIVITDLDEFDDEADDTKLATDGSGISISAALLNRLKKQPTHVTPPIMSRSSSALVLFRPIAPIPKVSADVEGLNNGPTLVPQDDDAMDIEP